MGKLLVIDGLDGSGKATQAKILTNDFLGKGLRVKKIDYPTYDKDSSALIELYLKGELSHNLFAINSFAASSFFACDHYVSYLKNWKRYYRLDYLILANRYVSSNAIHQMAKLSEIEWDDFLDWLIDYEFKRLGLPEPNAVIYLDMIPEISVGLIKKRNVRLNTESDLHEKNLNYLIRCRKAAFYCAKKFQWHVVNCFLKNEPLTVSEIARKIACLASSFDFCNQEV